MIFHERCLGVEEPVFPHKIFPYANSQLVVVFESSKFSNFGSVMRAQNFLPESSSPAWNRPQMLPFQLTSNVLLHVVWSFQVDFSNFGKPNNADGASSGFMVASGGGPREYSQID